MIKLLKETLDDMKEVGKTPEDVVEVQWIAYVGRNKYKKYKCSWELFASAIANVEYDNGYGAQEINDSLTIIFKNGSWMERFEYDGAEHWEYKKCPAFGEVEVKARREVLTNVWENPCCVCAYKGEVDECMKCEGHSKWEEVKEDGTV